MNFSVGIPSYLVTKDCCPCVGTTPLSLTHRSLPTYASSLSSLDHVNRTLLADRPIVSFCQLQVVVVWWLNIVSTVLVALSVATRLVEAVLLLLYFQCMLIRITR